MKDKNYSLIDIIINEKKILIERLNLLKQIEKKLKKGIGRFEIEIQFDSENCKYFAELGFILKEKSKYQYFINPRIVTKYEINCIE